MYSVSVGSVREAISMLVSAGLVETQAGRGTYVSSGSSAAGRRLDLVHSLPPGPLERAEVEELVEARELIEAQLAALAAERGTPQQIARLRACIEQMEVAAASPLAYPDADVEFHLALAEAAGNRYLLQTMLDFRSLLRQDMELGAEAAIRRFGDLRVSVESHRQLVDAIEAGDVARARETAAADRPPEPGVRSRALRDGPPVVRLDDVIKHVARTVRNGNFLSVAGNQRDR